MGIIGSGEQPAGVRSLTRIVLRRGEPARYRYFGQVRPIVATACDIRFYSTRSLQASYRDNTLYIKFKSHPESWKPIPT